MADNTNKSYTREVLNSIKRVDLCKIASSFKVSSIRTKNKEQLINDILHNPNQITKKSNKLELNNKYTKEELNNATKDALRPLASSLKVSNISNLTKEQLISAILYNQEHPPSKEVKRTTKITPIHVPELTLKSKFNNRILTYSYKPKEKNHSLEDVVTFLYSKIDCVTIEFVNYKVSIDLEVTFTSEKHGSTQFFINSERYTNFQRVSKDEILDDLQQKIDSKDTEGSGWVVESIDKAYLNITKFNPLNGSSFRELPDYIKKNELF